MQTRKRKLIVFTFVISITLLLACFFTGYFYFKNPKLKEFLINEVKKENDQYVLEFERVRFASKYEIIVKSEDGEELLNQEIPEPKAVLDFEASNDKKYTVEVIAYDRNGNIQKSKNTVDFIWENPTFSETNKHYADENVDFLLKIDGNIEDLYKLNIYFENNLVQQYDINSNEVNIPYNILKALSGRIVATITKDDIVLDKHNFYVNTTLVGNVKILSPGNNSQFKWDDILFKYEGGKSATEVYINLYNGNKFEKKIVLTEEETLLDAYEFTPGSEYRIELRAVFKDYEEIAKSAEINITIGSVTQVEPVYVNYNPDFIKAGTKIELLTRTPKTTIKYTIDGKDPKKYGIVYTGPIEINENVTIKAYAQRPQTIESVVTTYNFKVNDKMPIISLSPSRQPENYGAKGSGYTTEYEIMNKIADIMEVRLKEYGIKTIRSNPATDMIDWTGRARAVGADFHFAIHSNGSSDHKSQGVEIWVHEQTSASLPIANKIYDKVYNLYPYKSLMNDRGVRFSEDTLGEIHSGNFKCAALIEIAFHDHYDDATWIMNNLNEIANAMADGILEYYQVKDVE